MHAALDISNEEHNDNIYMKTLTIIEKPLWNNCEIPYTIHLKLCVIGIKEGLRYEEVCWKVFMKAYVYRSLAINESFAKS